MPESPALSGWIPSATELAQAGRRRRVHSHLSATMFVPVLIQGTERTFLASEFIFNAFVYLKY